MNWRELMKYQEIIPETGKLESILDILQELIPIKYKNSRTDTFISWVSEGVEKGLITKGELLDLQQYLINGYGGF